MSNLPPADVTTSVTQEAYDLMKPFAPQIESAFATFLYFSTRARWFCSSWIRESPSHKTGFAFDFAVATPALPKYDPLLYARLWPGLVLYDHTPRTAPIGLHFRRILDQLPRFFSDGPNSAVFNIESDHIHCHIVPYSAFGDKPYDADDKRLCVRRMFMPKGDRTASSKSGYPYSIKTHLIALSKLELKYPVLRAGLPTHLKPAMGLTQDEMRSVYLAGIGGSRSIEQVLDEIPYREITDNDVNMARIIKST